MLNFCTLFNSLYLTRGLAMYESLEQQCPDFHLYIFAFDDLCQQTLTALRLPKATVISLAEFEDERLLTIKPTRTPGEYCWTCTPATIEYCLERYRLPSCTYIDADLLFFDDPAILIKEMGNKSVLITDHRYTPVYDQTALSGRYCVQFMFFRNDENGRRVLTDWKESCFAWCYKRFEDGKFGDQKYLDYWMDRFEGVHELQHLGGGVAPWNIQQYTFSQQGQHITGTEIATGKQFGLVFYHYQDYKYCYPKGCFLGQYPITDEQLKIIYKPYIHALAKADRQLKAAGLQGTFHEMMEIPRYRRSFGTKLKYYFKGRVGEFFRRSYITG
ncbi:glycosyl transferase [Chitinophaga oryzae]|uniref:Glycosyl transferase n=1 Tax=Chitinophaga oryzae TaxID=2725414 RepID=A0AAE6ZHT1_9BACT|nr:glycosyl transferase [Chitinophaga oryzae]QJB31684.1 glycosyl transferase [Chitinophaga oryzae]QJB38168.1 glycosyl transferase [Chitinophaga oryzae]